MTGTNREFVHTIVVTRQVTEDTLEDDPFVMDFLEVSSETVKGEGKIRISHELSEGEKLGTSNRKVRVKKCLNSLGIPCNLDDVPNIAILGAGGGLRAMIALHGTLQELQNHGLLDTIMYLCGVSGSTWCMSSLYKNGDWTEKLQTLEESMCARLSKYTWSVPKATKMLLEAAKDENYSLTEFWAYTVVYGMLHELDKGHLSEQQSASENGNNPYPIYAAVDERSFSKVTEYSPATWFEFTPHEASFLGYGASVPMEYFGSEYKNGELKEQKEEKSMSYLQGLWGSAIGSKTENEKVIKDIFFGFFKGEKESHSPSKESCPEGIVKGFPVPTIEPEAGDMEGSLQSDPAGASPGGFSPDTKNKSITENIKGGVGSVVDFARMWQKTTHGLLTWKWGTNNNFLYKCSAFDSTELVKDKVISLVDAGIAINCAFPLVLRPERKVKLILSFDYGPFEPFKALKQTAKYCKENCIPFPEIDEKLLQEPDNPSDCYIFRGEGAPTVMHFPLFNRVNCPAYVTEWRIRFTMLRFLYHVGDITKLLQSARLNVLNNKDKILQEIKYIVAHSSKEASS
ncbi:peroxisomal sarcosine oxidase [Platysternon megacephalum]|uniref:Peroxisomal sarcosine oxidase n=1 Tax=Platysternon megacephalum TaxID=55544 RepID=A0A4D9E148_9SAUR|nr:peroxisomal sarcosine oxidase [Platysternon megacephalum]